MKTAHDNTAKSFWTAISEKKPPVNTAILIRGPHFIESGLYIPQNHFFSLRQVYGAEGELTRERFYGVTHWAYIPPLEINTEETFAVCPSMIAEVGPL